MNMQLMEVVLPRLAERLHRAIRRFRTGKLDEEQFTRKFEQLLQKQYAWLAERGVPEAQAAVAIHGAVLVLSEPGLKIEAQERGVPLEVVEHRAVCAAAQDVAQNYQVDARQAAGQIAAIVARYAD
jgi:hypothetical protein